MFSTHTEMITKRIMMYYQYFFVIVVLDKYIVKKLGFLSLFGKSVIRFGIFITARLPNFEL